MKLRLRHRAIAIIGLLAAAAVLLPAGAAAAHPLGNFTVNQYDGLVIAPRELRVDHVEDLAEIPARQQEARIDRDRNGALSQAELAAWAGRRCATAAGQAQAEAAGRALKLRTGEGEARVLPGQAGLFTLRVECELTADLPPGRTSVSYRPAEAAAGPGWRELTARGDRMTLSGSDVPASSLSRRLTSYPEELLSSPPDTGAAQLSATPGGPALGEQDEPPLGAAVLPRGADRWTQALSSLVARHELSVGFAALALGIALALGALHALAPGHGKTLMAAAASAGGRGSLREMLTLGASVTVTHTLGVFLLGVLVIAGSAAAPAVLSWLGIASGTLVAAAGTVLLRRAWRQRKRPPHHHEHSHHHHKAPRKLRGIVLLGFAGGLVPSPSAVVVLVGAAALGRAWFGMLLVLAYGAGLALTLTAAGFALLRLGRRAGRRAARRPRFYGVARRFAPLGSSAVVLALGCGLVLKGAAVAIG